MKVSSLFAAPAAAVLTYAQALDLLRTHKAAHTSDIKATLKHGKYAYTELVHQFCADNSIDIVQIFALPQKQIKRFCQFLGALLHNEIKNFDYTHARILLAMREAGSYNLTRSAIAALAAGIIVPNTNTRGITKAQINALFSMHHRMSTVETKVSNSTGKNGFYQMLGITYGKPGEQNREFTLNRNHVLTKLFFNVIDNARESQLREMVGANGDD